MSYTSLRITDENQVSYRDSKQWLHQHNYNPSNGFTSDGDIIRIGPQDIKGQNHT